jgi:hypothetical protein
MKRGRQSATSSLSAGMLTQRLRFGVAVRRAVDFAGRFAAFILVAGLRLAVVVAMSPPCQQANHLQQERITPDSSAQV